MPDVEAGPRRLVLAHGFTQTARSWATFEQYLHAELPDVETRAVDLPGHGDAAPPADLDLWASASRLVEAGGAGTYVGYSMGGRVALHAALASPDIVQRLVLVGATAGIDDPDERRARLAADDRLASHLEVVGVPTFIDEWLANPLFAGLKEDTALRSDRLRNTAAGLAASLRAAGTGTQTPLWERLDEIRCPVLVLVGGHDAKFTDLGQRLVAGLRSAELVVISGAGHSVHLEQPAATAEAIASWLA
ncbi:MAG TPA: alpha/beta fold hydrolase [Ilumatobacteraceae bacterium]|nr:alpha/beta fold hydrolase [Ilumatobacteraceae bacterium]